MEATHSPEAHPHHKLDATAVGLRTVATIEAIKGISVLVLGVVLLFVHQHAEQFSESLLYHLRIDPDRKLAQLFLKGASQVNDMRLWTIAIAAVAYACVRFTEAYGLWHRRAWAEWFAIFSGFLYLPWEILAIVKRTDWETISVLCINLVVILYMGGVRFLEMRKAKREREMRDREHRAAQVP
ncbi:MAG TPA: DUF2127 domain-containing protein [Bryobacteraceae bacterium]